VRAEYQYGSDELIVLVYENENPGPPLFEWNEYRGWCCDIERFNDDGTADLYNSGSSEPPGGGWEQSCRSEYRKAVPVWELSGYHERQRDQLFAKWREATFTRPPEGRG
jgi:hypothetical protein